MFACAQRNEPKDEYKESPPFADRGFRILKLEWDREPAEGFEALTEVEQRRRRRQRSGKLALLKFLAKVCFTWIYFQTTMIWGKNF